MAELLNQILSLPRAEQLRLIALVAANLQLEEDYQEAEEHPEWINELLETRLEKHKSSHSNSYSREDFKKEVEKRLESRKSA